MDAHLPKKNNSLRKSRRGRPWWCKELSDLWMNVCETERSFKKCKGSRKQKTVLRESYKRATDNFDKEFRKKKRAYFKQQQMSIESMQSNNPNVFWREIRKLGPKFNDTIPLEIVNDEDELETRIDKVLDRWRQDFESLFSESEEDGSHFDQEFLDQVAELKRDLDATHQDSSSSDRNILLNGEILWYEVSKFIDSTKRGKAVGVDSLPNEVF